MNCGRMVFLDIVRNIEGEGSCLRKLTLKDEGSGSEEDVRLENHQKGEAIMGNEESIKGEMRRIYLFHQR